MADQIKIRNLDVTPRRAADPTKDVAAEKLLVDAVLYVDTRAAGFSDEQQKSVDYGAACYFMAEYVKKHSFRLLEAFAEHLAEEILMEIPQLERVDLEVKRPWAQLSVPVESVSVAISRAWHSVDLAIGSNTGDRQSYVLNAVRSLESNRRCRRVKRSAVIEAQPYNHTDQPAFLNAAVEMQTLYTPRELFDYIHQLEKEAGRDPREQWSLRTLDIDIIFYDDCVLGEKDLVIPHPDMQNRMYVLGPLSELSPGRLHPVFQKSVMRMRRDLEHRKEKEAQA